TLTVEDLDLSKIPAARPRPAMTASQNDWAADQFEDVWNFVAARACAQRGLTEARDRFLMASPHTMERLTMRFGDKMGYDALHELADPKIGRDQVAKDLAKTLKKFPGGTKAEQWAALVPVLREMAKEDRSHVAPATETVDELI